MSKTFSSFRIHQPKFEQVWQSHSREISQNKSNTLRGTLCITAIQLAKKPGMAAQDTTRNWSTLMNLIPWFYLPHCHLFQDVLFRLLTQCLGVVNPFHLVDGDAVATGQLLRGHQYQVTNNRRLP